MIVLYIITAIFIAWIWVDYYRLIDIYGKSNLPYFAATFLMGSASVFIVFGLNNYALVYTNFEANGNLLNDFLFYTFRVGMVEEFAKMIPFLIGLVIFPKKYGSPIDYLSFICVSALGFSAAENVLYFYNHGPGIINGRAILSTVGHMFDTALIAYGVILYKYRREKHSFKTILLFFLLASLSHGFYDFGLSVKGLGGIGFLATIAFFMITISWFATILNNAINNSNNFTYKKVINSGAVSKRLLIYYGIVFGIQFVLVAVAEGNFEAIGSLIFSFLTTGFIVLIACVRLSRFKLIKDRWDPFKIEFPFSFIRRDEYSEGFIPLGSYYLKIKGESFNEAYISPYFNEYFYLNPTNPSTSKIKVRKLVYIVDKVFLKGDKAYYKAKLFKDDANSKFAYILLRPKTTKPTMYDDKHPVVAILKHDKVYDEKHRRTNTKKFRFVEWAFIMDK